MFIGGLSWQTTSGNLPVTDDLLVTIDLHHFVVVAVEVSVL